jgi:Helix-turn-helix of DDE superfamily endonuclease/DDE superfamily endonuclease
MITYARLLQQPRRFLALTGLIPAEFIDLLPAFEQSYAEFYPRNFTMQGQPRQSCPGAGRPSVLGNSATKLLFLLVYLKTYPLQVVLAELFGLSTSQANAWLHRLLPVLQRALAQLGVLPERDGSQVASQGRSPTESKRLIIDATERRRQRPKNQEKQRRHYSGKKKAHSDKNVLVVNARSERVLYLSRTYAGSVHEKKIVGQEPVAFPKGATLYKDSGFQGYEPPVAKTYQAKKKAGAAGANGPGTVVQPQAGTHPGARRARPGRCETKPDRHRHVAQHQRGHLRFGA